MPAPGLYTYRDVIDHLVAWAGGIGEEAEQRRARISIQRAYQQIARAYKWKYLIQHGNVWLENAYSTGTVAYDSSTRIVTLTSGTFPTTSAYYRIAFGTSDINRYRVQTYTDSTHVVLDPNSCPAATVAAGSTYSMWRAVYPLPGDFRSIEEIHDDNSWWSGSYVQPDEWLGYDRHVRDTASPWYWTIMGSEDSYSQMSFYLGSKPNEVERFDFMYNREPRKLIFDGCGSYSSAGAARLASASSTAATFTGVSLRADVVGAVLRTSDTGVSVPPTALGDVNQYSEQRIIASRTNATTIVTDSAWTYGMLGTHFTISDPIDFPEYLMDVFLARCESNMARMIRDYKSLTIQEQHYQMELRLAMAANAQQPEFTDLPGGWRGYRPLGMKVGYAV